MKKKKKRQEGSVFIVGEKKCKQIISLTLVLTNGAFRYPQVYVRNTSQVIRAAADLETHASVREIAGEAWMAWLKVQEMHTRLNSAHPVVRQ